MSLFITAMAVVLAVAGGCGTSPTANGPGLGETKRPETQPARSADPRWDPKPLGQITRIEDGIAVVDCGRTKATSPRVSLMVHREGRLVGILRIIEVGAVESAGLVWDVREPVRIGDKVSWQQPRPDQSDQPAWLSNARITAVKEGIASVNVGARDGLKAGMLLMLYRNTRFIGHLKIVEVEDAESAGLVVGAKVPARKGDVVTRVMLRVGPEVKPAGKIVSVTDGVAVLNVGSDADVKLNMRLVIYDKDRFVGYVKIIEVEDKQSTGVLTSVAGALPDAKGPAPHPKSGNDALPPTPQRGAAGNVVAVGLVQAWLDIGAIDGVRPRSVLVVRRGGKIICRLKAAEVHGNFCSALPTSGRAEALKIGDEVILLPTPGRPGP